LAINELKEESLKVKITAKIQRFTISAALNLAEEETRKAKLAYEAKRRITKSV
jgi:hypothetical protein